MGSSNDGRWVVLPIFGLTWVRDPSASIVNGQTVPLREPEAKAAPGGTMLPTATEQSARNSAGMEGISK